MNDGLAWEGVGDRVPDKMEMVCVLLKAQHGGRG